MQPPARNVCCPTNGTPIDVDAIQINAAMMPKEHQKLQSKGRCFHCKKQGHISKQCLTKETNKTPQNSEGLHSHQGMSMRSIEMEEKGVEVLAEEVSHLNIEDRDTVLDQIFAKGF